MKRTELCCEWFKRTVGIIGALLIFRGICTGLNYIYVETDEWGRTMWHHYYQDAGKIDNIYLGSSHVYCDINPMQLDKLNGQYNFNMASMAQRLDSSYYLLKEVDRDNQLSHVYLELYYELHTKYNTNGADPIDVVVGNSWHNSDFMKNSYNKMEYMLATNKMETYIDMLFPFCRYRTQLNDWNYIREIVENKSTEGYLLYHKYYENDDGNGYDEYMQQGYLYSTREVFDSRRIFRQGKILEKNPMGEKSEEYLRKIISYCQKQNIPLTLFVSPIMELQLVSTENYDNYITQVREIAEEWGIEFYDFNLVKEEYLPIQEGRYFRDAGHLNGAGASMFTSFFYEVISGDASENEKLFYSSYDEKLKMQAPEVYGLYSSDVELTEKISEDTLSFWIASNREEMEYRIIMSPNDGEKYTVQDFSGNKMFTVSASEHGLCTVEARVKEKPDEVQILEIGY